MKKIARYVLTASALIAGGTAFALDVDAHLNLEGNLANGGKGTSTGVSDIGWRIPFGIDIKL
ncbi:MAG: hypothetical protein IJ558_11935 [Treponema sp.]|nr:hypothetical protein [Treponema sp.]